jgi:hypothetical protein
MWLFADQRNPYKESTGGIRQLAAERATVSRPSGSRRPPYSLIRDALPVVSPKNAGHMRYRKTAFR